MKTYKKVIFVGIVATLGLGLTLEYNKIFIDKLVGGQVTNNVQDDNVDFDKFIDSSVLDADFVVSSSSSTFSTTWHGNFFFKDYASVSADFEVGNDQASSSFVIDNSNATRGACIQLKDADGSGYTYCRAKNGVLTCNTISCK